MFSQPTLFSIPDSPTRHMVMADLVMSKWPVLDVLAEELTRPRNNKRMDYLCLGCQVASGELRRELLAFAMYPLYEQTAEAILRQQLALQAYHPQAYEEHADPGPGGVVGIRAVMRNALNRADITASTAQKMWLWVDTETNFAYLDEEQAERELWALAEQRCAGGLAFLAKLDGAPERPVTYPARLRDDMHTLLGIAPLRRLVSTHLGRKLVLVDGHRLIGEDFLRWEHFYQ